MKESGKRYYNVICAVLLIAILGFGVVRTWPVYCKVQSLTAEKERLQLKIEEKVAEIAHEKENARRLQTDREYMEARARENRRAYPDEMIFIFGE